MKQFYRFTFRRDDDKQRSEEIEAADFDDAVQKACRLCERHECKIASIEWSEDGYRRQSVVQYT